VAAAHIAKRHEAAMTDKVTPFPSPRTSAAMADERRAIRRELTVLAERARNAGLVSLSLVIDLVIAQAMEGEWPQQPEDEGDA